MKTNNLLKFVLFRNKDASNLFQCYFEMDIEASRQFKRSAVDLAKKAIDEFNNNSCIDVPAPEPMIESAMLDKMNNKQPNINFKVRLPVFADET